MDEAAVNKLSARPLRPYLDRIAAMQSTKELPALLAGLHTSLGGGGLFFNFGASQDYEIYLRWHTAHAAAPYLAEDFVNENFKFFSKTLRGVPQLRPRWKRCVSLVDDQLGEALGQEFVARAFSPELKQKTKLMTPQIEHSMEEDIDTLEWMSPGTKQQALQKLHGHRKQDRISRQMA